MVIRLRLNSNRKMEVDHMKTGTAKNNKPLRVACYMRVGTKEQLMPQQRRDVQNAPLKRPAKRGQ